MKVSEANEIPESFDEDQIRILGELGFEPKHKHLKLA